MKKFVLFLALISVLTTPCFAMRSHTNYTYEIYQPQQRMEYYEHMPVYEEPPVQEVVIRTRYDGINTTANVISAISNLLTAIRVLTW